LQVRLLGDTVVSCEQVTMSAAHLRIDIARVLCHDAIAKRCRVGPALRQREGADEPLADLERCRSTRVESPRFGCLLHATFGDRERAFVRLDLVARLGVEVPAPGGP
jgi:hypothetical protein